MKSTIVLMKCITNLHVGSGEENYNLVDNEVEKDCLTSYPVIHASGIKGALREYFTNVSGIEKEDIQNIFGADTDVKDKENIPSKPGKIKFFQANMLAKPFRATSGDTPYHLVTTKEMIDQFNLMQTSFLANELQLETNASAEIEVEEMTANKKYSLPTNIGKFDLYLLKNTEFQSVDLPVIARNRLNNGISEHLWFEEVVPHESLFSFVVTANDNESKWFKKFVDTIDNKVVQFGGNASIGCGFCKLCVLKK